MGLNRSPLFGLIVTQLALQIWMAWTLYNGFTAESLILIFFSALLMFTHLHFLRPHTFLAEVAEVRDRGEPRPVELFGDVIMKTKTPPLVDEESDFWNRPLERRIIGAVAWVVALFLCVKATGQLSGGAIVIAFLGWLTLHARRLFQWLWVNALGLIVMLIASDNGFQKAVSCILFLLFLATYRQAILQYSSNSLRPFRVGKAVTSLIPTLMVFVLAFAMAAFFFPDEKLAVAQRKLKNKIAKKIAERKDRGGADFNIKPRHNSKRAGDTRPMVLKFKEPEQGAQQHDRRQPGSNGDGDSGGVADAGGDGFGSNDGSESGSGDGTTQAQTNGTTQAQTDGAKQTPTKGNVQKAEERKREKELETVKWRLKLDQIEKILKVALCLFIAWLAFNLLAKKPGAQTRKTRKRLRRRNLAVLKNRLSQFGKRKFPSRRDEVIAAYHLLLELLGIAGMTKQEWQTPSQFQAEVEERGLVLKSEARILTPLFSKVYYGESKVTDSEYAEFRKAADQLSRAVF